MCVMWYLYENSNERSCRLHIFAIISVFFLTKNLTIYYNDLSLISDILMYRYIFCDMYNNF